MFMFMLISIKNIIDILHMFIEEYFKPNLMEVILDFDQVIFREQED